MPNAIGKTAAKPVHPVPDSLPADQHAPLDQKIWDIGCAESETMVCPDRVGDDLTRETKVFLARHCRGHRHPGDLTKRAPSNDLAIPREHNLARLFIWKRKKCEACRESTFSRNVKDDEY